MIFEKSEYETGEDQLGCVGVICGSVWTFSYMETGGLKKNKRVSLKNEVKEYMPKLRIMAYKCRNICARIYKMT